MKRATVTVVAVTGFLLRLGLLIYGEWQDAHFQVKYTDIDYHVFSDAALNVLKDGSPYDRSTYRYTPLLSFLMLGNHIIHPATGKIIFILSDALVASCIYQILITRGIPPETAPWWTTLWWWNPFVATIATRGNAESIIAAFVLLSWWCLLKGRTLFAGALFGLAVHFKIYPVIYAVPFLRVLDEKYKTWRENVLNLPGQPKVVSPKLLRRQQNSLTLFQKCKKLLTKERLDFFGAAGVTFLALTGLCLWL
jgi:phosphatidylinositol glycan class M